MSRVAILVASVVLAASAPIVVPSPAAADTPGCVTEQEFYRVDPGMRKKRVHQIFDTRGRVAWREPRRMHRYYKICGVRFTRQTAVHVVYRQADSVWKVRRKWADAQ